MTQFGVNRGVKLYLNEFDLSGNLTAGNFAMGIEGKDSTRYGTSLSGVAQRTEDPGLAFTQYEASTLWEAGAGTIDNVAEAIKRASDVLVTHCPLTGTAGERCYLLRGIETSYRRGEPVGEMSRADLSMRCSSVFRGGNILYNGSVSATSSGSAFQLGAVGAAAYLYAWIHVLSGSGSLTAKVQSDDNSGFTSATDRVTFSAISGTTYEYVAPVAGAIADDYWRANFTVSSGGPFGIVMAMAIL